MKHEIIKELLNFMDGLQELDSGICDEISGNAIMDYGMQKKKLIKDTADRIIELFKNYIKGTRDDRHINLLTNYTNPASKIMEGEVLESAMGTPFLKIDYDKFQEALKNYIGKDVEIYIHIKGGEE